MRIRDFFRYGEWVILKKGTRFLGLRQNHYDGPIMEFGLWWWTFFSLGYDYDAWRSAFDAGFKLGSDAGFKKCVAARDEQVRQIKEGITAALIEHAKKNL